MITALNGRMPAALYTTAPGGTAYARKALTWVPGTSDGVNTATATQPLGTA